MRTQKKLAWQALKLAKDRLLDSAIVIAYKLAFEIGQPTAYERDDYRAALIAFVRASLEYAKTIQKEDDK